MKMLLVLGLSYAAQWIASPMFFAICGAKDDAEKCLLVRAGIFVTVLIFLSVVSGKK